MSKMKILSIVAMLLLVVAMPILVSCSSTATPTPTPTTQSQVTRTIEVGMVTDLTGPTAESCNPMLWAWQDYFDSINRQPGAFNGVRIEVAWVDCKYQLDLGLQGYQKFQDDSNVLLVSCPLTNVSEAAAPLAEKAGLPFLALAPAPKALWQDSTPLSIGYGVKPSYSDQLAAFVDWAIAQREAKGEVGPFKLALMYLDAAFGKAIFDGGVQYAKARGVDIVAQEPIEMTATDSTANLARIKNSGADYVYFQGNMPFAAMICKDAVRTGFNIPLVNMGTNPGAGMIAYAGQAAEGLLLVQWALLPGALNPGNITPGLEKVSSLIQTYRPSEDPLGTSAGYSVALPAAIVIGEAVKKAVAAVGVDGLNRQTLKTEGLDKLVNVDVWDVQPPITYTAADHRGGQYIIMGTIENQQVNLLSGWIKTPIVTANELIWSAYLPPQKW